MRNRAGTMPLKHRSKEATNKRPPTHGITASGQTREEQPAPSRVQENSQDDITELNKAKEEATKDLEEPLAVLLTIQQADNLDQVLKDFFSTPLTIS